MKNQAPELTHQLTFLANLKLFEKELIACRQKVKSNAIISCAIATCGIVLGTFVSPLLFLLCPFCTKHTITAIQQKKYMKNIIIECGAPNISYNTYKQLKKSRKLHITYGLYATEIYQIIKPKQYLQSATNENLDELENQFSAVFGKKKCLKTEQQQQEEDATNKIIEKIFDDNEK